MERRLFTPADRIAPGFYMKYWDSIIKKYDGKGLMSNKLKQYREVRNGAILAALWTKTTGRKHFVSFPSDEPADVEIYSLEDSEYKGKPSYSLVRVPVQLTRCSLPDGETIVGQINNKNKQALANTTLVVHLTANDGDTITLNDIVKEVQSISPLYPKEVAIIAPLLDDSSTEQTFGQVLLSSADTVGQFRTSKVSLDDIDAFFEEPPIMHSKKGTGRAITEHGEINLMLP
jgi:hypothetical protein